MPPSWATGDSNERAFPSAKRRRHVGNGNRTGGGPFPLPLKFFDQNPYGELMSRLTNDIENINNTLSQSIAHIFSSVILLGGAFAMMLALSPSLTILSLLVIPLGVALTGAIARRTRRYFSGQQIELGQINAYIEGKISGARFVKAFGRRRLPAGNSRISIGA